jgi:hypothetical protein
LRWAWAGARRWRRCRSGGPAGLIDHGPRSGAGGARLRQRRPIGSVYYRGRAFDIAFKERAASSSGDACGSYELLRRRVNGLNRPHQRARHFFYFLVY